MEFLDEDTKPRFLLQSGAHTHTQPHNKPTKSKALLVVTLSLSSLLLALSLSEPFKSLLIWLSLSLLLGPFAPLSLTAGDIRVGQGPILHIPPQQPPPDDDAKKHRRSKPRRSDEPAFIPVAAFANGQKSGIEGKDVTVAVEEEEEEEKEWTEEDIEILKKQMVKHPVGKPGRWDAVAAAFGGRHRAESVIKKAKELGEKKVDDSESYAQFLKKRKPVDKRVENSEGESVESGWSSGEDIALLNALKAFPKDVPMRWDKVAAAVPGKSKAACIKRVSELKKGFRSAKAAADAIDQ